MVKEKMMDELALDSTSAQYLIGTKFNNSIVKLKTRLLEWLDTLLKPLAVQLSEIKTVF